MPQSTELRVLEGWYLEALSQYQSFSMCLYDTHSLEKGSIVSYGMDGYDLCQYLFPRTFFLKPSPYHEIMQANWQSFFDRTDGKSTFVILSPFSILELLTLVAEIASDRGLARAVKHKYRETYAILEELVRGGRPLSDIDPRDQATISRLYEHMTESKAVNRMLRDQELFGDLHQLVEMNTVKTWDAVLIGTGVPIDVAKLLSFDRSYAVNN